MKNLKKPKQAFEPKKKERIPYRTVSYRLPVRCLDALEKYVDDDKSACSVITQLLEWALPEARETK